jgi:hypothetical protein
VLSGTGTVNGAVANAAAVSPGTAAAPGRITINGSYTQTAAGSLNVKLGGRTTPGQDYDQVVVNGTPERGHGQPRRHPERQLARQLHAAGRRPVSDHQLRRQHR